MASVCIESSALQWQTRGVSIARVWSINGKAACMFLRRTKQVFKPPISFVMPIRPVITAPKPPDWFRSNSVQQTCCRTTESSDSFWFDLIKDTFASGVSLYHLGYFMLRVTLRVVLNKLLPASSESSYSSGIIYDSSIVQISCRSFIHFISLQGLNGLLHILVFWRPLTDFDVWYTLFLFRVLSSVLIPTLLRGLNTFLGCSTEKQGVSGRIHKPSFILYRLPVPQTLCC